MSREHTRMRRRLRRLARKHGTIFRNLGRWAGWPRRRQRKALAMKRKREWAKRGKIATIRRGQWGVSLTLTAKTLGRVKAPPRYAHLFHFVIVWSQRRVMGPFAEYRIAKRNRPPGLSRMDKSIATYNKRTGRLACNRIVPDDLRFQIINAACMNAPAPGEDRT